jgi:hypothetical protein
MNVPKVLLTVGMWFACRKYHPTFGIPGTEIQGVSFPEQLEDLGRGWEWWPSVLWQLIWTWVVSSWHNPRHDMLVTYTDICRLRPF